MEKLKITNDQLNAIYTRLEMISNQDGSNAALKAYKNIESVLELIGYDIASLPTWPQICVKLNNN